MWSRLRVFVLRPRHCRIHHLGRWETQLGASRENYSHTAASPWEIKQNSPRVGQRKQQIATWRWIQGFVYKQMFEMSSFKLIGWHGINTQHQFSTAQDVESRPSHKAATPKSLEVFLIACGVHHFVSSWRMDCVVYWQDILLKLIKNGKKKTSYLSLSSLIRSNFFSTSCSGSSSSSLKVF